MHSFPKNVRDARYGPAALVTGASEGIGRAFADDLARRGYDLVLVARRESLLEAFAAQLRQGHGIGVSVIGADLSDPSQVEKVISDTAHHDIGLFVAAAGFGTSGLFVGQPVGPELEMIDVNCRAVAAMTHAFARRFMARGRGGIVLMSSLVAFQGGSARGQLRGNQSLSEGLRPELARYGVDVVACAPGPIKSGFAARANMVMAVSDLPEAVARETLDKLGRKAIVRPGRLAKILEAAFTGVPRWGRVKIMSQVMKGMTSGDREPAAPTSVQHMNRPAS